MTKVKDLEPTDSEPVIATEPVVAEPAPEPPVAEPTPEPVVEATVEAEGRWQCLNEKCKTAPSALGRSDGTTFVGLTQPAASSGTEPVTCPECGGQNVIYAGDIAAEE